MNEPIAESGKIEEAECPQAAFAILYLDDLTIAEFGTRAEREIAKNRCFKALRPFISLRYGTRISGRVTRQVWMPQETHYLSNL